MNRTWARRVRMLTVSFIAAAAIASNNAAAAQNAHAIFEQRCAACHGSNGMGDGPAAAAFQPPPEPFPKALKGRDDAWIAKIIRGGRACRRASAEHAGATIAER